MADLDDLGLDPQRRRLYELWRNEWADRSGDVPSLVYHYTSVQAARSIIHSGTFWATHASDLNDATEVTHAANMFREIMAERSRRAVLLEYQRVYPAHAGVVRFEDSSLLDMYVTSLTAAEDDLSQWDRYADHGYGVAIGMRGDKLGYIRRSKIYFLLNLAQVEYDPAGQRHFMEWLIDRWAEDAAVELTREAMRGSDLSYAVADQLSALAFSVSDLVPLMKSPYFAAEREWRLTHSDMTFMRCCPEQKSPSGKRYIEIPLRQIYKVFPLGAVWLGPGIATDANASKMRDFLGQNGLSDVPVHLSKVPLRLEKRDLTG